MALALATEVAAPARRRTPTFTCADIDALRRALRRANQPTTLESLIARRVQRKPKRAGCVASFFEGGFVELSESEACALGFGVVRRAVHAPTKRLWTPPVSNAQKLRKKRKPLTAADVVDVRRRAAQGESYASIAARFGSEKSTIGGIVRRETWKDVP